MDLKNVELLAPAGDLEGLNTALKFGADAIYCGGPFMQLRAASAGFDLDKLATGINAVHSKGKKLYVTVNSFANNDEIPLLGDYAKKLLDLGVDAIIVSDIGAVAEIKEKCPDMEVHISTQANTMNYKAAEVYYNMGAKRVVLARELSLEKIAEFRAKAPKGLDMEAFVHGAMCMSYSGRCLLSAFLTGRSGNRGQCAQSCRWNYYLMEEKRPGEYYKIEETENGSAILSSKELCAISIIEKLAEIGICSFKIEGRMRTPFYTATVVNAYKMFMNAQCSVDEAMAELDTVSHRPFTTGFYLGSPEALQPDDKGYVRDYLFLATAKGETENGKLKIETRNAFNLGDEVQILSPGKTGKSFKLDSIVNEYGEAIERSCNPMKELTINMPYEAKEGDILRMKINE